MKTTTEVIAENSAVDYTDKFFVSRNKPLYCPICKKELMLEGFKHLQTLSEHVSNPNEEPTEKYSFICSNKYCVTRLLNLCWNSNGEIYTNTYFDLNKIKFIDDIHAPFGSWQREWEIKQAKIKKDTYRINIKFLKLMFDVYLPFSNIFKSSIVIWYDSIYRYRLKLPY